MEAKLEQYRLKKRREEKFEEFKGRIKRFLMLGTGISTDEQSKRENHIVDMDDEHGSEQKKLLSSNHDDERSASEDEDLVLSTDEDQTVDQLDSAVGNSEAHEDQESNLLKYILWAVYFFFWCTVYIIAIELKFGIVFLMLSALFGIYFNTRTGPKRRNEISAYSVFNKNCESIDGTLKAEQFEREMRYGAGSVR